MPVTDITIVKPQDPPIWNDADPAKMTHLQESRWKVAIIDHGMSSGKPSIAYRWDIGEDGETMIAETSLASLIGIMAAARGAFPEAFVGGPFEDRS